MPTPVVRTRTRTVTARTRTIAARIRLQKIIDLLQFGVSMRIGWAANGLTTLSYSVRSEPGKRRHEIQSWRLPEGDQDHNSHHQMMDAHIIYNVVQYLIVRSPVAVPPRNYAALRE